MRQKDFPLSFPAILGRDVSGVVRAVGANVKHFKAGDRVLALSYATYAELVAVDDSDVTHLPDGVDLADAAAIPLIALTGDQLVRLATNVQKGTGCSDNRSAGQCWARGSAYGEEDRRAGDCRCSRERAG